ncbi:MAG: hypothetical protein B7Z36_05465 [Novosphingobium sp. 12-63-9]|nr:MAG: hypothetical protein B7Z36_05465 [Novosphingobium sp. 12-63-9]
MSKKFESFSEAEAQAIVAGDIERQLPHSVREVLLDVILAWANLEMATGFFVASVLGINPDEGAERFGRKEIADKLKRAANALRNSGKFEVASKISEISRVYPEMTLFRRRIAHSKCAGVRKSVPSRVVFLPFEREGEPGNLAVEVIEISKFSEAVSWANDVHKYLMQHVDGSDFFGAQ